MSYIFVQDSGHMYLIPEKRTLVNLFDHEVFELYRVDNRSEGLIESPEDFKELVESGSEIGYEIGNILDLDLDVLEEAVYVKKYGVTSEELSLAKGETLKPWEDGRMEFDGYFFSYSVDRWFPKYSDNERMVLFNKIMARNKEY